MEEREVNPQSGLPGGNIFTSNTSANVSGLTGRSEDLTWTYRGERQSKGEEEGIIEKREM